MFIVGATYTRADVGDAIGYPDHKRSGGNFTTGYFEFDGAFYIFTNVGLPGRTGHDYPNRWRDADLVWYGKSQSKFGQPQIEKLIDGSRDVHVFWRGKDRAPFTYAGTAHAIEAMDTHPVEIAWGFDTPFVSSTDQQQTQPVPPVWRRGPPPSSGERSTTFEDNPTSLYLMRLAGATNEQHPRLEEGLTLIKVGISVSPKRRLRELNSGFPPGLSLAWEVIDTIEFPTGEAAFAEESRILEHLRIAGSWIGGEYAVSKTSRLDSL